MQQNRHESGQSIIIIVFIVLVILALLALVVDIGNAYAQRRVVQNAVDAAAMACATKLAQQGPLQDGGYRDPAVTDTEVETAMRDYAEINGLDRNEVQGVYVDGAGNDIAIVGNIGRFDVPVDARGVRVQGDLTFATYFAHLLGVDEITVNAPGAAYVLTGPCSGEHLFPITLFLGNFAGEPNQRPVIGTDYIMWDHNDKLAPGNFGWIYWVDGDGNNRCPYPNCKQQPSVNNSLRPNINDTTRSGLWRIGDWVHGSVGVNFQPVLNNNPPNFGRQLEYYVDGDADDDWPTVIIPIYDDVDGTGNNTVFRIAGFGAFHMTCAQNSKTHYVERDSGDCAPCGKTDKCVIGEFVRWVEEPFEDGCIDTGISAPSYRMPTQP